jgi:hypothetical protein
MAVALPAYAATVVVTYTGTASGTDRNNTLGAGNVFADVPFVATYSFDTSIGSIHNSPTENYVAGNGADSPSLGASFSMNGHTLFDIGKNFGELYVLSNGTYYQIATYADYSVNANGMYIADQMHMGGLVHNSTASSSLSGPFDGPIDGSPSIGFYRADSTLQHIYTQVGANLTVQHVTVNAVAAVPEPATWTTMLAGFVVMGFALRRRRKQGTPILACVKAP